MKTNTLRKALSLILALAMCLTGISTVAFANTESSEEAATTDTGSVSGTLTVGEQELTLTNKKVKYSLNNVSVGDSISFACDDSNAVYTISADTAKRVPMLVTLNVTASGGDAWTYEIRLCEQDVYAITDVAFAGGNATPYRIYSVGDFSRNTAMTAEEIAAIEARYGEISPEDEEYWAGTDGYLGYPSKSESDGSYKIYYNSAVIYSDSYSNVNAKVIDGETFIFKHNKTQYNRGNYYAGGVGAYDGTNGSYYLSFKINKPGTMYLVDKETMGMPNAIAEGFARDTSVYIMDKAKAVYSKHFTIPEGELTATVNIPSYGWDTEWGYSTEGNTRSFMNPSLFVFIFDTDEDTSVSKMTYTALGKEYTIAIDENTNSASVNLPEKLSEIEINVEPTSSNATVSGNKIALEDGSGEGVISVISGDGIAVQDYVVTFSYIGEEMLFNGQGNWVDGMYVEEGTVNPGAFAAIKSLSSTKYINVISDRSPGSAWSASEEFLSSTYIMMSKNGWGQTSYKSAAAYRDGGEGVYVSDAEATYTVTVGSGEPQTFTLGEASDYSFATADTAGLYLIKDIKSSVADSACFTTNDTYIGFDVNAACRVFVSDRHYGTYPNLDKSLWTKCDDGLDFVGGDLYCRDFEAGDTVIIPTYGMSSRFTDAEKDVKIEYTDANGEEQTIEYNLGEATNYYDYLYVAVAWEKDASLSDLAIGGKTVDGFDSAKTSYSASVLEGEEPSVTYTAAEGAEVIENKGEVQNGKMTYTYTVKNGVYSTVYTIEFTINEAAALTTLTFDTNGAEIKASVNGGSEVSYGVSKKESYAQGSEIKATAIAGEGQTFMYWKEVSGANTAATIISETEELKITAATDRHFTAVFTDTQVYTVSFRANGKVLAEGAAGSITVPAEPYVAGYSFAGWFLGGTKTELKEGDTPEVVAHTIYQAGFTLDNAIYKVTVDNGSETTQNEYLYNTKVSVSAAAEKDGAAFSHWERDGETVSYSREYSFYVSADTALEAVYAEGVSTSPVVITLSDPAQIEGTNKISFYAERNVAAEYTVAETGILLSRTADIDLSNHEIKAVAKSCANVGQYTVRKANVSEGEVWYGVAYVVYKDANGNTKIAYSKEKSASVTLSE